ncbi:hypothetical protein IFM89_020327 [Coptis chinensis]|uniref:Uncharacterized protein n=1 Tax=Coptis chinensis TaxID=261450 RepID=A0A835H7G7_9MAGN|nr:hypothetical protein IFM89_020327 [Coptis chinensis]
MVRRRWISVNREAKKQQIVRVWGGRTEIEKIAATSYDYDNDSRWADYWSNILIPPHLSSRSDVIHHFKHKFYQRYIDHDLVVDPMPSTASQSSSSATTGQTRTRSSGSSARTTAPTSLRWDRETIQFSVNAWVFIVAVLAILPLTPRNLSFKAYRLSFMGTLCSSLYSLYSLYGKPRAWNLQGIQVWIQSVFGTKDFIYFLYCLMFVTSQLQLKFALIPVLCQALDCVSKFLRRNFSRSSLYRKYLEEPCLWVESNTTTLSILSSHAEIGLGFVLIISLLSWQRNIIQTLMYWQVCVSVFTSIITNSPVETYVPCPVTAGYHQSVWTKIGQTINQLVNRYAPFLNTPISTAQR